MTRSTWSGGVTWSGTAKWMPDGLTASGPLRPDVAIAGTLRTGLQTASWRLGINGFLDELSPGSCSLSFAGTVSVEPGDTIVISIPAGVLWVGRVDSRVVTYDEAQHTWTTVTGTDSLGALATAYVVDEDSAATTLEEWGEYLAAAAGVSLDIVDDSVSGLPPTLLASPPVSGAVLDLINSNARRSNAMAALHRDGTIHAVVREAVTPADQVDIIFRYRTWVSATSLDVDINRWTITADAVEYGSDDADIAIYGQRTYEAGSDVWLAATSQFDDWIAYGGSQRSTETLVLPMKSWADEDVMLLNPFDWVEDGGTDYQVMSVAHAVSVSPPSWDVTLTLDTLLSLL